MYVWQNFWKASFDGCVRKLRKNQLQITLWKPSLLIFSQIFSQNFSNRPYPNVKKNYSSFLHHKNYLKLITNEFWLLLLRFFDFSNNSPCWYTKLRIPFFLNSINFLHFLTNAVVPLQSFTSFEPKLNLAIDQWFKKLLFNLQFCSSSLFLMLCSYELRIRSTMAGFFYYIDHI